MEQRTDDNVSPYRIFSRAEWAAKRHDTPMTLTSDEVMRLRSLHDRLDMTEVEEIYLPLSRLLSFYVAATQRLFHAQQNFLGTEDAKMPYIIGVAGSVAVGKDRGRLIAETADLIYHLLVVLAARGITLAEVEAELAARTRQSGLQEKASRKAGSRSAPSAGKIKTRLRQPKAREQGRAGKGA